MDASNSSYKFNPKAPENWTVQTRTRKGKTVRLIRLKPWQVNAYLKLRGVPRGIIRAFCGSGKTILARAIGAYKIVSTGKRQVFCVPKNDIGNDGFANYFDIEIPWEQGRKKALRCEAPLNFCSQKSSSKIEELIRILCQNPVLDDCAGMDVVSSSMQVVVTHQCLTLAIKKIEKNPRNFAKFIANNTFWIDEAHHIKGHDGSEEEKVAMNLLGKFANRVLDSDKHGVELFAMTATPFRGDYSKLFSSGQMDDFASYSLDFLDHFPTLGIERVDIDMEEYSDIDDVICRVSGNIGNEVDNRHLVFVPPKGIKWRVEKNDVDGLFEAIYAVIMRKTGCDLAAAKSQVLDLVTENTQAEHQKLLRQEPKSGDAQPSKFRVVVACMLCREGSDWCPADRIHNTSMEDSAPLNFQTNGRLFRHYPGKKHVKICYYLKRFRTISCGKREFVSDRLNYILHYMLMDDLLNPIMVTVPPFKPQEKNGKRTTIKGRSTLEEIFGHKYQDMKLFLLTSVADVMDFTESSVNQIISQTIEIYLPANRNLTKRQLTNINMALKAFLLRCRSSELREKGVDVSFIRKNGFDEVVESNGIAGGMFTSKLSLKELNRFRETVKKVHFTDEQRKNIAEGIRSIVSMRMPDTAQYGHDGRPSQEHIKALESCLNDFISIQKAYAESSETNRHSLEDVARLVKKPTAFVRKMIGFYNKFCLPRGIKFDFKKDSKLAKKIISLGQVA